MLCGSLLDFKLHCCLGVSLCSFILPQCVFKEAVAFFIIMDNNQINIKLQKEKCLLYGCLNVQTPFTTLQFFPLLWHEQLSPFFVFKSKFITHFWKPSCNSQSCAWNLLWIASSFHAMIPDLYFFLYMMCLHLSQFVFIWIPLYIW